MIKIMIVDDMPIFLEYLKGCLDWGTYGFEICCEAADGREALEKMELFDPDIVLTDITMPYLNGLELAEEIIKHYPDTAVILITGNSEFEYAKRAVKIGVCDYIVKPFEKEELLLALLKLQDNISRAVELKNEKEEVARQKGEMLLRRLILSGESGELTEKIVRRLAQEEISFQTPFFLVCTMRFVTDTFSGLDQIHNWENVVMEMLQSKLYVKGSFQMFRDYENGMVLILNFETEEDMKSYHAYELEDIQEIIRSQLQLETVICISDYCYGLTQLSTAYFQAIHMPESTELVQNGKIRDYRKINAGEEDSYYSWNTVEQLQKSFERLDEKAVEEIIRQELNYLRDSKDMELQLVFYSGFIGILMTNIINSGRNVEDVFGTGFRPYHKLKRMQTSQEREELVIEYFQQAIAYEKQNSNKKSREVAEQAKAYIREHYMEPDISIADISKELLINQTYLRKMFKSETNQTLSEYITRYRMKIARQMIQETNEKLTVIAELTGYNDVSYFSKCFKRYYGTSPKNIGGK